METLEVSTKSDYFRLDKHSVRQLVKWCEENELPDPFPNWNEGDSCEWDLLHDEYRIPVRGWLDAFEEAFPMHADMGVAGAIIDAYRGGYMDRGSDKWPMQDDEQYPMWIATAWHHCLHTAFEEASKVSLTSS